MKIAVISDLHVESDSDTKSSSSWLSTNTPERSSTDLFNSLVELIDDDDNQLNADILLCCGDIADRANLSAQKFAWDKIHSISKKLNCKLVIGTAGNHDLDSRFASSDYDTKGGLQSLVPIFPGIDDEYSNHYWARNFAFYKHDSNTRILNINSCAFHGYGKDDLGEYMHGRISQHTLENIEAYLKKDTDYDINLAFFHHHPLKSDNAISEDYSEMDGGSRLLELLANNDSGDWLVVHGHKHYPNIIHAPGGSDSPVILSAGSFASKRLYHDARVNQFYIIEIEENSLDKYELPLAGNIEAWNWGLGIGWEKTPFDISIPYGAGFGSRVNTKVIAGKINSFIEKKASTYTNWSEIIEEYSFLKFVLPSDLKKALKLLEKNHNCTINFNRDGWPDQIAKVAIRKDI